MLWAEERREAGEKGLFVGPTGSCQRGLAPSSWRPYVPTRPSWTETYQAACVEPEKGLGFGFGWTLDLVYCAGTTPSSKTGTLWGISQESRCCSCPGAWGRGRSAPTRPALAMHQPVISSSWVNGGLYSLLHGWLWWHPFMKKEGWDWPGQKCTR